jgi:hypothetical protein
VVEAQGSQDFLLIALPCSHLKKIKFKEISKTTPWWYKHCGGINFHPWKTPQCLHYRAVRTPGACTTEELQFPDACTTGSHFDFPEFQIIKTALKTHLFKNCSTCKLSNPSTLKDHIYLKIIGKNMKSA